MAATNLGCVWKKNIQGERKGPLKFPVLFASGASQAIKQGELLDLATGTAVPLASDKAMTAGIIAIACSELKSGDLAGYYDVIIPTPGDIFEMALAAAANPSPGASLYFSTSQILATSGSNVLGFVCDPSIVPIQDAFASVNPAFDVGTTMRTVSSVLFTIKNANSYFSLLQG